MKSLIAFFVGTLAALTVLAPLMPARAHTPYSTWVPNKWSSGSTVHWFLGDRDGTLTGTDDRDRITGADNAWNNLASGTPTYSYLGEWGSLIHDSSCPQAWSDPFGQPSGEEGGVFGHQTLSQLATTISCVSSGTMGSFSMTLDDDRDWYSDADGFPAIQSGEWDLQGVATHEFGHGWGFGTSASPKHFTNSSDCPGQGNVGGDDADQTMCALMGPGHLFFRTLALHDIHTLEGAY